MANPQLRTETLKKSSKKSDAFPLDGEYFYSPNKKSDVLVFFVHFYKGNKRVLKRHIEAVNQLGFDAFAFNLKDEVQSLKDFPMSSSGQFGLKHCLADQIELLLNLLPGPKVIFSFSNPTAAAIEAIYRRNSSDILALVADSGPSGKYLQSALNLFNIERKIKFFAIRVAITPLFSMAWSPHLHKDLHTHLAALPAGFRILSIRGWKDELIPPDHIDAVFEPHPNLDWTKLSLPEAKHLTGLRDFPEEYIHALSQFLEPFLKLKKVKTV